MKFRNQPPRCRRPEYREASWFEREKVQEFYKFAKRHGYCVDHIVPRKHPDVCGLHCYDNLQVLTHGANAYKSNKYWPDSWNEQQYLDIPEGLTGPVQMELNL